MNYAFLPLSTGLMRRTRCRNGHRHNIVRLPLRVTLGLTVDRDLTGGAGVVKSAKSILTACSLPIDCRLYNSRCAHATLRILMRIPDDVRSFKNPLGLLADRVIQAAHIGRFDCLC